MDWLKPVGKFTALLNQYKYFILVIVLGICLMLIPSQKQASGSKPNSTEIAEESVSLDTILSECLSKVEGAGRVQVILTVAAGEEILYQTDRDERTTADSADSKVDTVIITNSNHDQQGLVRQVIPARYQGAIILCQGADRASVRLALTQAVSVALNLSTDRITVLKMK